MSNPLKQSLHKTSLSFLALTILLVFSFTLSGCGGGGGGSSSAMMPGEGNQQMPGDSNQGMTDGGQQMPGGSQEMTGEGSQEPMRRELMLGKINEIQATEGANNSDDHVVTDILRAAANQPRGLTSRTLGVASTSQNSGTSSDVTNARASIVADYDAEGMLQIAFRRLPNSGGASTISTTDQDASVNRIEGIPAAGWEGVELRGESTSWYFYVDVFSDIEDNADSDYLFMGYWLRERKEKSDTSSNYSFGIVAGGNDPFVRAHVAGLTGTATYEGPATGLYMLKANATAAPEFDYFNAKASLTADFADATALGSVSGTITEGMTDGGVALPDLTLEAADFTTSGSDFHGDIGGDGLAGKWGGKFYSNGAGPPDHPGSVAGTFGAKTADDLQAIVGAFAAHKN